MLRALFEKNGNAVWISHLDLMRLFQRAFKRAGLSLTHTQGYNPRPSVSIALPLSVGVESQCELLDFELDGQEVSYDEIRDRLNTCLVQGVRVLSVYNGNNKIGNISYLHCTVTMEYDSGVPDGCADSVENLVQQESLLVDKKTKNGIQQQDIIPMIHRMNVIQATDNLVLDCVVCCQNPTLNPMQLVAAIRNHLPDLAPNYARCCRLGIYDRNHEVFR